MHDTFNFTVIPDYQHKPGDNIHLIIIDDTKVKEVQAVVTLKGVLHDGPRERERAHEHLNEYPLEIAVQAIDVAFEILKGVDRVWTEEA